MRLAISIALKDALRCLIDGCLNVDHAADWRAVCVADQRAVNHRVQVELMRVHVADPVISLGKHLVADHGSVEQDDVGDAAGLLRPLRDAMARGQHGDLSVERPPHLILIIEAKPRGVLLGGLRNEQRLCLSPAVNHFFKARCEC